ncbi:hypothetical protein [Streptomyces varsoviensis]|uniref:hypothetical protein n=1 Tax=Streptomyces varsoviensis TaxID=67373 RepID=UPI00068CFE86|nr:hypothetical protein [Streptomyces varsoviensis]
MRSNLFAKLRGASTAREGSGRRTVTALLTGLTLVGGLAAAQPAMAQPAAAQSAGAQPVTGRPAAADAAATPKLVKEDQDQTRTYHLNIDRNRDYLDLGKAVTALENSGAVTTASPLSVAQSAQHTGRKGLCHNTELDGTLKWDGFCWDPKDDAGKDWTPQGLTGSHDANRTGTIDGHHLYVASWHGAGGNPGHRVTIAESDGSTVTYGHVLLVRPTGGAQGFAPVDGRHADGVVWYGSKLLVANGNELEVYDMRHLWKMDAREERVGMADGKASARWHDWALPMVARYTTGPRDGAPGACEPGGPGTICLSSLSLDRASNTLVSGEFTKHHGGGRVARWPLDEATAMPKSTTADNVGPAQASVSYVSPVSDMQGVASDGSTFYMAGLCPGDDPEKDAQYSCLQYAEPGGEVRTLTKGPIYTQNLSWDPNARRLWGLNERPGKTVVFSIKTSR